MPIAKGDGIFCFADSIAAGVIKSLIDRNMQVGKDVLIVGYDNLIEEVEYKGVKIGLSSIAQDLEGFAQACVEKICQIVNNESVESEILPVSLIIRESSGSA